MVLEYFDPFSYQDYLTQIKLTPKESWDIFIEEDKKFAQKALEQNYERYRCDFSFLKDESRK